MPKRNAVLAKPTHFSTEPYVEIDGFAIHAGDIIKIKGEYGSSFKFIGVTTNKNTGASWIDCFEISRGVCSASSAVLMAAASGAPIKISN